MKATSTSGKRSTSRAYSVSGCPTDSAARVVAQNSSRPARMSGPLRMNALNGIAAGVLLSLFAMQAMSADAAVARRTLTPDDLYRVQDVSDPQVSPDGAWVAYVLTTSDREADEARSAIWMVSWDGSQQLALTAAAEGTVKPRWSPDGRYLAFMATPPGADKAQIMLSDRRGGPTA